MGEQNRLTTFIGIRNYLPLIIAFRQRKGFSEEILDICADVERLPIDQIFIMSWIACIPGTIFIEYLA